MLRSLEGGVDLVFEYYIIGVGVGLGLTRNGFFSKMGVLVC